MTTRLVDVHAKSLRERDIHDFEEWANRPDTLYIGRGNSHIKAVKRSKWANPFTIKKYGLDECLSKYEDYIRNHKKLFDSLHELKGMELGCWCSPNKCHGDILIKLIDELYP